MLSVSPRASRLNTAERLRRPLDVARPLGRPDLFLPAILTSQLMVVLDTTIVNVALPSIRTSLGFSEASLAWVVNAYLLTFGGFLLLGGRLGDLFGHRRLFLSGIAIFTLASLACGLAPTQGMLIAARAVQGIGGAVVSAVALSLIMNLFVEAADRAKAMGVIGFVSAGGGSIGVLLGGVLTSLNWHAIFLVNLPVGIAVLALSRFLLPSSRGPASAGRLDIAGAITVTVALMLAVYAIVNGNAVGWLSAPTLGLLAGAASLLALFLAIEARVRAAHAARPVPAALGGDGEWRGDAVVRRHVRLVLPLRALSAKRAGL
jgi:MFS family permease